MTTIPTKEGMGFAWSGALASFVAPVVVVLCQAVSSLIEEHRVNVSVGPIFLIGLPISILPIWLLGMPFVLYLRRMELLNAKTVCIGGAFFGALFLIAFLWIVDPPLLPWPRLLGQGSAGGFLRFAGGVGFFVFWGVPFLFSFPGR